MAKKNQVYIDVIIDDKGTTKRVAVNAKKLGAELDKAGVGSDRAAKGTDKLSKSTKDLDRNMRGTAKMSSNQSKNFSKMQQGMGGLVGAYATLAAQVFAVTAAFQFLQTASDFRNLISGQEAMGAVTGVAYKSITASIIEATDAQIQYGEAARAAAIGTAAGLTGGQLTELGAAAKNASFALGRDLTDSFNRLVRGVTKAEPELLDELGIILRLENATEKYAAGLGKAASELNAFERTQAVTNDVLEQAERKFGAIEALMDPNAAALNQFTKSFDDLIKSFQVGVINILTPALTFLTNNTTALVATLSLVSLPILKAILPSMRDWRDESRLAAKEAREHADDYIRSLEKQNAALADSHKARQAMADKAAAKAAKTAQKQGTAISAGGGLAYLTGGEGSQGGAARILSGARKQMEQQSEITTGILKGYDEQQLRNMEKSYAARSAVAKNTTTAITGMWARTGAQIKRGWLGLGVAWNVVMGGVAKAAAAAAIFVNAVFTVAGVVGAIALVVAGVSSLVAWLIPANEELERQEKLIEKLTDKYKTLNEELGRSRIARRDLLGGTDVTSNIGKSLQSIDVPKFLQEIKQLQNMDKDADGYEELLKDLNTTEKELGALDSTFPKLVKEFKKGGESGEKAGQDIRKLANELINTGQEVDSLAEKYTQFDKSFASLTKSLVKTSPLQNLVRDGAETLRILNVHKDAIEGVGEAQETSLKNATDARDAQREKDQEYFDSLGDLRKLLGEEEDFFKKDFKGRAKLREIFGIETVEGLVSDKEVESRQEVINLTEKQSKLNAKRLTDQERLNAVIEPFETQRVARAKELNQLQDEATGFLNAGLSIQGKIDNLEQERVNNAVKLEKATQARSNAELAVKLAREQEKSEEEIQIQLDLLDTAKQHERTAERRATIQSLLIDNKETELLLQKDLLSTMKEIHDLEAGIAGAKIDKERDDLGLGTGGFQNATQRRQADINILTQEKTLATKRATVAAKEYRNEYDRLLAAEKDRIKGDRKDYQLTPQEELFAAGVAQTGVDASTAARNVAQAENAVKQADLNLKRVQDIQKVLANTNNLKIESLGYDAEAVGFGRENKVFAELYRAERAAGIPVEKINVELLRQQAKTMNDLAVQTEARQGIFDKIESSMQGAFTAVIDGSKSAKQAFGDMARSILQHLAKVLAEMMVAKIVASSLFQSFGFETGGITPPKKEYAKGGYTSPRMDYSRGGVARGPQSGYNAVLHGNEAVVPLPDNRHIPVEMTGGGGQQNNVTVNVNMDNQGQAQTSSQSDGPQAERMGTLIAKAVQTELQNQKRSGGILSPYGAS